MLRYSLVFLLTLPAPSAFAAGSADSGATVKASQRGPTGAALRAYRDPKTGRLVEAPVTDAQRRFDAELGRGAAQSKANIEPIELPDGSKRFHLGERYMHYSIGTRSNGELTVTCVGGAPVADLRGVVAARRARAESDAR